MRPDDPAVSATPIDLPSAEPPTLFVVVDTEEEFDWSAPFSRQSTSVTAMRHIGRAQQMFDRFGIVPTYVVDYPVASKPEGVGAARRVRVQRASDHWRAPPSMGDAAARRGSLARPTALR